MAVFRVEKTKNYTVMANHHLQNKELSLKAKGLLSMLLSLPDTWEHSIAGYAAICRDGVDGVSSTIKELEKNGYIIRTRLRNDKGHFTDAEYTILELPQSIPKEENPKLEKPILENPILDKPQMDKPKLAEPILENPLQLNTKQLNTKELNPNVLNPYLINQKIQGYEMIGFDSYDELKSVVYENIEYEHFRKYGKISEVERIKEIADIIIETLCSTKPTINVAGEDYPSQLVKDKMLKISSSHIEYVFECMKANPSEIRNIKRYLLATLFNAPSTMDNYYTAKVNHDFNY